jgi:tripartite-type tricarboxylate transporter receptor subunit TctC
MSLPKLALGALLASFLLPVSSQTANFPDRPIKLIVPWAAGGNTDAIARLMATKLSTRVHQPVVVDNRPGANGIIGSTAVARSQPDGYTLLLALPETNVLNPMVYKNITYSAKDFEALAYMGEMPFALVSNMTTKAGTVPDLVRAAKEKPGTVSAASWGVGSTAHAAIALMEQAAGLDLLHVPFTGTAPAMAQLYSGQVDLMFLSAQMANDNAKAGKVKVLGVTSGKRLEAYPDYATLAEQGMRGFDVGLWYGFMVPAKTPAPIRDYLSKEILAVLQDPAVLQDLRQRGMVVQPQGAEQFARFLSEEDARWSKLIKAKNIRIDN